MVTLFHIGDQSFAHLSFHACCRTLLAQNETFKNAAVYPSGRVCVLPKVSGLVLVRSFQGCGQSLISYFNKFWRIHLRVCQLSNHPIITVKD
jgi:hypothetical protein